MAFSRCRVLFFAEGATLAHVVRPLALARLLDAGKFDVTFCRPPSFGWLTRDAEFSVVDLECQPASTFSHKLEAGWPLYNVDTLRRYVDDDLALMDTHRPQVVVGDFRLSLSVSARRRSVPYIALCDAYWSPERPFRPPLPVLRVTPYVPLALADAVFRAVSGVALRFHSRPMEQLRRLYGLPSLGGDIRRGYTDADLRLFANFPALFPDVETSDSAAFVGPITWFPEISGNRDFATSDEPLIYVTLGSSGSPRVLEKIVPILEQVQTECRIVVATAGKAVDLKSLSKRTRLYDFLPGNLVCQKARLVVCNGGSPTTSQALANGVPVLGIAQNMDQLLNMQAIEAYGAGRLLRADRVDSANVKSAVEELMLDRSFADRAGKLASSLPAEDGGAILSRHILSRCGMSN